MQIGPLSVGQITAAASNAVAHKDRYIAITARTGVPWPLIAALHRRESDADWNTYLGNGDSIHHRTTHVPRGRGPFASFEDGAVDALRLDGLDKIKDWPIEKMLYEAEIFNGTGYNSRGLPSPYLWGKTNIERPGKFIADGHFDSHAVDGQSGVAPILFMIAKLDSSVTYSRES